MDSELTDQPILHKPSRLLKLLWAFAFLCLLMPTMLSLLASQHWTFDLLTSFHVQYAVGLLPITVLFLLKKQWKTSAILFSGLLYNLYLVLPVYYPAAERLPAKHSIRLLVTNVLSSNRQHEKLLQLIHEESPDIILAVEVNDHWSRALHQLSEEYPHSKSFARPDNFGIALLSRLPFHQAEILSLGDRQLPTVFAEIQLKDDSIVSLIGTHPLPPKGRAAADRNQQLAEVASFATSRKEHVILCGDLNVTPWSPYFEQLLHDANLKDSRQGFGIQPTWPAGNPLLRIPIDHILVSDQIQVRQRRVCSPIGSDHLPVIVELGIDSE